MRAKVTKAWDHETRSGLNGKTFTAQNLYADENGEQVIINATGLDDLSYLQGKEIDLSGSFTIGSYNGKKTIKVNKKTNITVVAQSAPRADVVGLGNVTPVAKPAPTPEPVKAPVAVSTDKTEEEKIVDSYLKILELLVRKEGPGTYETNAEVAKSLAATVYIQNNKKK